MMSTNGDSDSKLKDRGEKNTLLFVFYVISRILCENKLLYFVAWTTLVVIGVLQYFKLFDDCANVLEIWKPMISIFASIGAFTAPFIFVTIAIFPSFSDKFRNRLEQKSPSTGRPKVQSMLNHFTFVLLSSLGVMLFGYLGKYLSDSNLLSCSNITEQKAILFSSTLTIVLMLLFATIVELIRSVRTIYVMIMADYTSGA